ncbi:MAG: hypothetical protein JWQ20_2627 [Conexibacter sp.]|nr:hypothetical protein [Conexibacter sp.]
MSRKTPRGAAVFFAFMAIAGIGLATVAASKQDWAWMALCLLAVGVALWLVLKGIRLDREERRR